MRDQYERAPFLEAVVETISLAQGFKQGTTQKVCKNCDNLSPASTYYMAFISVKYMYVIIEQIYVNYHFIDMFVTENLRNLVCRLE